MKKTVIMLLLINLSFTIHAQERQNDATWEECIEFLSENRNYLHHTEKTKDEWVSERIAKTYKINNDELIEHWDNVYIRYADEFVGRNKSDFSYPLKYLESVISEDEKIVIYFSGGFSKIEFPIENYSMRIRLEKAFKQLAYLAKEIRTEEQRAKHLKKSKF